MKTPLKIASILTLLWLMAGGTESVDAQTLLEVDRNKKPQRQQTKFLKLLKDAAGNPTALQTSITRYESKRDGVLVDLVGAVHIGERKYYQQLNKQLGQYDVVLYELVAPKGTRIPTGGRKSGGGGNPLSWMQGSMKSMLGLESQLERIDYQSRNFVHADLSPKELSEKMSERGDSMLTVALSAFSDMMRQQNLAANSSDNNPAAQMGLGDIMELMQNPLELKRMMASQFTAGGAMEMGLGKKLNQLIVVDRNKAALKELKSQLRKGQKRIAIFYGAAHMPDFEEHLVADFDLKKTQHVWVNAWDLTKAPRNNQASEFSELGSMFMNLLESLDR